MKTKVILAGESAVGKTTLISRFLDQPFGKLTISTAAPVFIRKTKTVDGIDVDLEIWDTAGQEMYRSMMPMYFRGANVAVLCFSLETVESIPTWANLIIATEPECKIILALTKSDLINGDQFKSISGKVEEEKTKYNALSFIPTSSFNNTGIEEIFDLAARFSLTKNMIHHKKVDAAIVKKKKGCCK